MPFPESPRVIYEKNPLKEVICQLRFPTVLKIDSEPPARFQERIRSNYPLLEKKSAVALDLPPELAGTFELKVNTGQLVYEFQSSDEMWTVGLSSGSLSLTSKRYERWEEFRAQFLLALNALVEEYTPAFYSRIGLRYKNLICRSAIGLEDDKWPGLLRAEVAGVLGAPAVGEAVQGALSQEVIRLASNGAQVRVQHGLVLLKEVERELCYLIDSDFFTEGRVPTANAIDVLNQFNTVAARLFRWCISDRLHEALVPHPI